MQCSYMQHKRISVFVQFRRVHLFIVNCLLKNKFNILCNDILLIFLSQHYKPNFHAKNIIWLKFTINYSLFKLNYNWRLCSAISLTVVMFCVCTKEVCVCNTQLARPTPFPFPLFLLPGISTKIITLLNSGNYNELHKFLNFLK